MEVGGLASRRPPSKSSRVIHRYRMLTSRESNHLNIRLISKESFMKQCDTITLLQSESFLKKSKLLKYIKENID